MSRQKKLTEHQERTPENEDVEMETESESSENEEDEIEAEGEGTSEKTGDTNDALKETLSTLSFEELQKLQERLGSKVFNQAISTGKNIKISTSIDSTRQTFKRANKNRPMEMSSKKPTRRLKNSFKAKKKMIRDPRFDDLSGEYDEQLFKKSYRFIDDLKSKEKVMLTDKLKETENPAERKKIHRLLDRIKQQENTEKQKAKNREKEKMFKSKEKELVEKGKTPFYLKKSEKKKLELADKFKELKESGKLEKYLTKKRKKIASKDKKHLPNN